MPKLGVLLFGDLGYQPFVTLVRVIRVTYYYHMYMGMYILLWELLINIKREHYSLPNDCDFEAGRFVCVSRNAVFM